MDYESYITGDDLRQMQKKAGLTNAEMAKLAGVKTRKTYENWINNVGKGPSFSQFISMCIGCKIKVPLLVDLIIKRRKLTDELDLSLAEDDK